MILKVIGMYSAFFFCFVSFFCFFLIYCFNFVDFREKQDILVNMNTVEELQDTMSNIGQKGGVNSEEVETSPS